MRDECELSVIVFLLFLAYMMGIILKPYAYGDYAPKYLCLSDRVPHSVLHPVQARSA